MSVVNLIVTSGLCFKKNISIRSGVLVYCCEDTTKDRVILEGSLNTRLRVPRMYKQYSVLSY